MGPATANADIHKGNLNLNLNLSKTNLNMSITMQTYLNLRRNAYSQRKTNLNMSKQILAN